MAKRKAKYLGTGIHIHDQFNKSELVKGDTFFDADYGMMIWTGKQWANKSEKIMATKKQLAWRKKFAAMAKKRSKAAKKKKRSKINGTTTLKIPSNKKNRTVQIKRGESGKFSISGLKTNVLKNLEHDYGNLQIRLLNASTKAEKKKIKKKISEVKKKRSTVKRITA